jgi:hypothetical protein
LATPLRGELVVGLSSADAFSRLGRGCHSRSTPRRRSPG